jgi:hypothetical protein
MWLFEDKELIRRLAVLALVLSLAAACDRSGEGVKPTLTPGRPPTPKDWTITVGPDPCQLTENGQPAPTQRLKREKNFIVWKSDSGQSLTIRIHVPKDLPNDCDNFPFSGAWQGVGPDPSGNPMYEKTGDDGFVFSGPPRKKACPTTYKYDQILGGKTCDGMIIIDP